ncbi:hypothetical protein [Nonomuraea pusilla]|uniref:Uncharacterized protein n=1 Tax=Nonomuraea pusilla TaxID=46177 RepID=A0A1H7FSL9_9ACTN|nr:hypothetical protein [Nonomuraea pusilla]SEK28774.1 hypothetical protein SAMN05660976_00176 [Nonomuraea pusilla]
MTRTLAALAAALLGLAALTGCAQRDERHPIAIAIMGTPAASAKAASAAPRPSASASAGADDAMLKLTQCLRQNGIDVPDPGSPEERTWKYEGDQATLEKAVKACEEYASQIPNPLDDPKMRDQLVQVARCMREQGFDVPDPPQENPNLDINDPKFQAAGEKCARQLQGEGGAQ